MTAVPDAGAGSGPGTAPGLAAPAGPPPAVRAAGIVKDYGFRRVLDGVSLEVGRGRFLTVFGPNGAGKTTLIRILTMVTRPSAGTVEIAGREARGSDLGALRARMGLITHQTLLYDGLSGWENLVFFARLYGVERPKERAAGLLSEFRLWERRNDPVGTYSRGMQQRLAIARALVHNPEILFLDEPFTGLDPAAARMLSALLEQLKHQGRSALLTTHDLAEGLAIGDRWSILSEGRVAVAGECRGTSERELSERYFAAVGVPAGAASPVERDGRGDLGSHAG